MRFKGIAALRIDGGLAIVAKDIMEEDAQVAVPFAKAWVGRFPVKQLLGQGLILSQRLQKIGDQIVVCRRRAGAKADRVLISLL